MTDQKYKGMTVTLNDDPWPSSRIAWCTYGVLWHSVQGGSDRTRLNFSATVLMGSTSRDYGVVARI